MNRSAGRVSDWSATLRTDVAVLGDENDDVRGWAGAEFGEARKSRSLLLKSRGGSLPAEALEKVEANCDGLAVLYDVEGLLR